MARRKATATVRNASAPRRSTRSAKSKFEEIPSVYKEILAEVAAKDPGLFETSPRPAKRPRLGEEPVFHGNLADVPRDDELFDDPDESRAQEQRIVLDDFEASDEELEDEFEDVDLDRAVEPDAAGDEEQNQDLQLDLSKPFTTPTRSTPRRKPVTPAERAHRLSVHKTHLLCLIAHMHSRNQWCNSEIVQTVLKPLVTRKTINLLHVDEDKPQFQRNHSFNKGIEEVCALWRGLWQKTTKGMRRAYWRETADLDLEQESDEAEDVEFDDFLNAANSKSGSRDLGAQLFCALLRALAIDTRLVCSLQVLPFSAVAKGQTPEKPKPAYIYASSTPKKKRIVDSPYPIWWVEVFSPSISTWIPLDPIVRDTINKPRTGFEPPANDNLNKMSYVIAFEEDGSANDLTRRYAQWFNAKILKTRVECTKHGEEWYQTAMAVYEKQFLEPRDEIEDAELLRKAEREPMPSNVQDFKGHPVYVLESQLRQNEVIWPNKECGKFARNVKSGKVLENVYRRNLVRVCRSADAWYRKGRDVKSGEAPLKRGIRRGARKERTAEDMEDEEEDESVPLYAEFQTDVYVPPPVKKGKVPKTAYGNLDVYVPSMIPPGAVHVKHPLAKHAAKVLELDYADAVTGFDFKGRQGTAVVNGVVVPASVTAAMAAVIEGLETQATEEIQAQRTRILIGLWKKWLTALRIRDKVEQEYGGRDDNECGEGDDEDDEEYHDDDEHGGGFMFDADEVEESTIKDAPLPPMPDLPAMLPDEVSHHPIVVVRSPHKLPGGSGGTYNASTAIDEDMYEDLFDAEEDESGFVKDVEQDQDQEPGGFMVEGGGFLGEDEPQEPGGFMIDDADLPQQLSSTKSAAELHGDHEGGRFMVEDGDFGEEADLRERGGFVVDNDDEPLHQLQPYHPVSPSKPLIEQQDDRHAGGFIPKDDTQEDARHVLDALPQHSRPVEAARADESNHKHFAPDQEDEEVGSVTSRLSHDPEEDDQDPDWLMDSLDAE